MLAETAQKFDGYSTVKDAAEFLGFSPKTLRNWDQARKLQAFRHPVNKYRLYRPEGLQAVLRGVGREAGP